MKRSASAVCGLEGREDVRGWAVFIQGEKDRGRARGSLLDQTYVGGEVREGRDVGVHARRKEGGGGGNDE